MKLSGYHKTKSGNKTFISDFFFISVTYGQINFATSQIPNKAMGEKPNPSHTHQVRLFYHELSYIRLLLMIQLQILVGVLDIGHLGSPEVTNRFLLMTHD